MRQEEKAETKASVKHWLDDRVSIIDSNLNGKVNEVRIEGTAESPVTYYKVRYWSDGQCYSADFADNELRALEPRHPIGFRKE